MVFFDFPLYLSQLQHVAHIDNGLHGLGHVGDDAVCDDQQHKVTRAVPLGRCKPAIFNIQ